MAVKEGLLALIQDEKSKCRRDGRLGGAHRNTWHDSRVERPRRCDSLVFFDFLFDVANLLRYGLKGLLEVGILDLQFCAESALLF